MENRAKQKAGELVEKFETVIYPTGFSNEKAKQCALILCDEIINASPRYPSDVDWDDCGGTHQYYYESQVEEATKFWQSVKHEINNIK